MSENAVRSNVDDVDSTLRWCATLHVITLPWCKCCLPALQYPVLSKLKYTPDPTAVTTLTNQARSVYGIA